LLCRTVFAVGQRPTIVDGPRLEDEAAALNEQFWNNRRHLPEHGKWHRRDPCSAIPGGKF
jgi:hypothetical protein